MKKKVLAAFLCAAMTATMFAGCGGGDDKKDDSANNAAGNEAGSEVAGGANEEENQTGDLSHTQIRTSHPCVRHWTQSWTGLASNTRITIPIITRRRRMSRLTQPFRQARTF